MKKPGLRAVLLALTALSAPLAGHAAGLDQFVGFGDSTLDTGYFRYTTTGSPSYDAQIAAAVANGSSGAWVGAGVMDGTILAGKFGLAALPVSNGGTNYANGGAQTVQTTPGDGYSGGAPTNVPTVTQISNYLTATKGIADPNALYLIATGGNDAFFAQQQIYAGNFSLTSAATYLSTVAAALAPSVASLQKAGAKTIVVPNMYAYSYLVGPGNNLGAIGTIFDSVADTFYAQVWSDLTAAGVRFVPADFENVFKFVSQNPTLFGFTAASVLTTSQACSTAISGGILCGTSQLVSANAEQTDLFASGPHLTTAGQTIEADYIYSLLIAPSEMSLLPESVVQSGLARTASIQAQIDLSQRHRGPSGINEWASAGGNELRVKDATGFGQDKGAPFLGSLGVDYKFDNGVILGAALSFGTQNQDFTAGGDFTQQEQVFSLYAAYRTGNVWGDMIVGGGNLENSVTRQVTLGSYTDTDISHPKGQTIGVALRAGTDFTIDQITTGPVIGLTRQQVTIKAFSESSSTGITALAFDSQSQNSLVTPIGWRASIDLGAWQPFAEADYDHEWNKNDRAVTASLLSVAAPSYSMAAVPAATNWGTGQIGTTYQICPEIILRGGLSSMFANDRIISYGGEVGLNASF